MIEKGVRAFGSPVHPSCGISCSVEKASMQEGCTLQRAGSLPERLLLAPGIPKSLIGQLPQRVTEVSMIDGLSEVISKHCPVSLSESS